METFVLSLFVACVLVIIVLGTGPVSAVKAGIAARVYVNSGTYESPTWVAANLVRDAQPSLPWDFADASSRQTRAKLYGKTQVDLAVQLVCRADDADTIFQEFVDAAVSPTEVLDMLILDGPLTAEGARGFRAHWLFSLSGAPQGAGDNIYNTFDLKPGYSSEGVPQAVVMGASSTPTFAAF